ncbi:MAG: hypothetical protein IJ327_07960, partial [Lachnospiraceae bacterium]|nr:hypothetical protein [Lachnospiraceae bacterium]
MNIAISEGVLRADGFTLEPGVYKLKICYDALGAGDMSYSVQAPQSGYRSLLANGVTLYHGQRESECQFYVTTCLGTEQGLAVEVNYANGVSLEVHDIEIRETNQGSYIYMFMILLFSTVINMLMMLREYVKRYILPAQWWLVRLGIVGLTVLASLPLFTDYILTGPDSSLHLLRIEFLAQSIGKRIWPVRVGASWLFGHGYANSLFYCDTFLVFPAVLRLIGFPMTVAYGAYVFLVNAMTATASYWSFKHMFKNQYIGMFGCMLYTLLPYRIYNIYNRCAVGEYTAMIFLPIICYGFYLLLANETSEKNYKHYWLVLVLGFSGIIQCHVLSCEIMVGVAALLCVLCVRRVFRKQTFIQLIKAVIGTVFINLWFLVPMLDMMISGEYYYSRNAGNTIQHRGIVPANIFYTLQRAGNNSKFAELGMQGAEPINVGIAILLCVAAYLILRKKNKERDVYYDRVALIALILGGLITVMSLDSFPWDRIQHWNQLTSVLVPMVQFPTRFTIAVGVAFTVVACVVAKWIVGTEKSDVRIGFFGLIILLSVGFSMFQTNDILLSRGGVLRLHSAEGMGHSGILGAEYLPIDSDFSFYYHGAWPSGDVMVIDDTKAGLETYTTVAVKGQLNQETAWIELPLLYYKGYQAEDVETGDRLEVV